jgi:hypothetical protein
MEKVIGECVSERIGIAMNEIDISPENLQYIHVVFAKGNVALAGCYDFWHEAWPRTGPVLL